MYSDADNVLEIDTEISTVKQICAELAELEGGRNYKCLAAGVNGKLYAPPCGAGRVLEIDPETSSVRQIGDEVEGGCKCYKYFCIAAGTI